MISQRFPSTIAANNSVPGGFKICDRIGPMPWEGISWGLSAPKSMQMKSSSSYGGSKRRSLHLVQQWLKSFLYWFFDPHMNKNRRYLAATGQDHSGCRFSWLSRVVHAFEIKTTFHHPDQNWAKDLFVLLGRYLSTKFFCKILFPEYVSGHALCDDSYPCVVKSQHFLNV